MRGTLMAQKPKISWIVSVLAVFVLAGCATEPWSGYDELRQLCQNSRAETEAGGVHCEDYLP